MRELNANEDKLLRVMNSPWFIWGSILFWALFTYSDYHNHRFSWIDGLLVGALSVRALIEITVIVIYRCKKNAAG